MKTVAWLAIVGIMMAWSIDPKEPEQLEIGPALTVKLKTQQEKELVEMFLTTYRGIKNDAKSTNGTMGKGGERTAHNASTGDRDGSDNDSAGKAGSRGDNVPGVDTVYRAPAGRRDESIVHFAAPNMGSVDGVFANRERGNGDGRSDY